MNSAAKKNHIVAWDTLRFACEICVVLYHTNSSFGAVGERWLRPIYVDGGRIGVYFFFVLGSVLAAKTYRSRIAGKQIVLSEYLIQRTRI